MSGSIFGNWDAPWADDPTGTFSFTLPSGGVCEQRIGDLEVAHPDANTMIHAWLNDPDLTFGYDADYDADYEYVTAMHQATYDAVHARLLDEGYTDHADHNLSWSGELRCTGDNPYPALPDFLPEDEE